MESLSNKHNSQLYASEEDLNKNSEYTKNQQNKNTNNQLLDSQNNRSFNLREIVQEQHFTRTSLLNQENLMFNSRVYQDYIKTYHKLTTLYFISEPSYSHTKFFIYDTIIKKEKLKVLDQNRKISFGASITQLPNGDYFCFGGYSYARIGTTLLIDINFHAHELPSGNYCFYSSCIYYNRSVYCFGGNDDYYVGSNPNLIFICNRFDLDKNKWIKLSPTPEPVEKCNTVVFNGNILISNPKNIYLWLYSIDINSFSIIPYEFNLKQKVMVNTEERLYLIECDFDWFIYESDVWDEFTWTLVANLEDFSNNNGRAFSCIYNKEENGFYIGSVKNEGMWSETRYYYKFNLNGKMLIKANKFNEKVLKDN